MPRIFVKTLLSGGIIRMPSLTNMKEILCFLIQYGSKIALSSVADGSHVGQLRDPIC